MDMFSNRDTLHVDACWQALRRLDRMQSGSRHGPQPTSVHPTPSPHSVTVHLGAFPEVPLSSQTSPTAAHRRDVTSEHPASRPDEVATVRPNQTPRPSTDYLRNNQRNLSSSRRITHNTRYTMAASALDQERQLAIDPIVGTSVQHNTQVRLCPSHTSLALSTNSFVL
jgi:hypothetical protein